MTSIRGYPKDGVPHELRCPHTIAVMRPVFCGNCTQEELEARYLEMNQAYRKGAPIVSDQVFDRYEKHCRTVFPECQTFQKVGETLEDFDSFLNEINDFEDFLNN